MAAPPVYSIANGGEITSCESLKSNFKYPDTEITAVQNMPQGAAKLGQVSLPAHCQVSGNMYQRTGEDGTPYQIGFEMRLPNTWNGRFYYQANGGLDGAVVSAFGALGGGPITGALMQGFAVISSDAGHTVKQNNSFGLDPQARLDYGYQAVQKLTPMAKKMIVSAYGQAAKKSYIGGCSNGGRHTMVAAARIGDQYDGYLIGAPGYRLPLASLTQVWTAQQFNALATPGAATRNPFNPGATIPDLSSGFTPQERLLVRNAILNKCDGLSGVKDGIVSDYLACQKRFNLASDVNTCEGARDGSCLTEQQKNEISKIMEGPKTKDGRAMYAAFPFDAGISGKNWALWKQQFSLVLDPVALGSVFMTPPERVEPLDANIDHIYAAIASSDAHYSTSSLKCMVPPGQDDPEYTTTLRRNGAKLLLYHGTSDPVFSVDDTRAWVDRVTAINGSETAGFVRFFPVPEMNHCNGGPAADQFDLLTPLVQWVEQGKAPDAIVATARGASNAGGANTELPQDWPEHRERVLCAYPQTAHYVGTGSSEKASNFVCR